MSIVDDGVIATKLDECDRLLLRLSKMCCEPGRSPRLQAVADELTEIRSYLEDLADRSPDDQRRHADQAILRLESAGAALGRLQIGCCAPARMPLYAETLVNLTDIQLAINASVGRSHD